jgi:hypothetical protein
MQQPIVGPGLCECGCGGATPLATYTNRNRVVVKGQPSRFVHGHSAHNGPAEFWRRIERAQSNGGGCSLWPGPFDIAGYGTFGNRLVHREMFTHSHGPISDRLWVLHKCDNPPCWNPAHLFPGTHEDNMRDMASKGRHGRWNVCLTAEQVHEMRRRYADGESQSALGRAFGVSHNVARKAVLGITWAHI